MEPDLFERHPLLRVLLWLGTIIAALILLGLIWLLIVHFSGIILLFFLAWVISFILQPLSKMLERRHIPRPLAVLLIYLALFAVAAGGILLAIPTIHSEVQLIAGELTGTLTSSNLTNLGNRVVSYLHGLGLSERDARSLVNQFAGRIPELTSTIANNAVQTTAGLLGAAINLLFNTVVVLILSFYMMMDGDRLLAGWIEKLPPSWLPDVELLQRHIDQIFGGFLRAQLILAFMFGVVTYIVLVALGQPNGLIFAIVAALLMLIPFIGPVLALLPPLSLILLQASSAGVVFKLIVAGLILAAAEWIILQFVAPHVMGAQVGLHPLLLFAALLIGAEESGIWGALFAGPIAAVLVAVIATLYDRFREASGLYTDGTPAPALPTNSGDSPSQNGRPHLKSATTAAAGDAASASRRPAGDVPDHTRRGRVIGNPSIRMSLPVPRSEAARNIRSARRRALRARQRPRPGA